MLVVPPQEVVDESLRNDAALRVRLAEAVERQELPQTYYDHVVVRSSPGLVVPYSLFVDAVLTQHQRSHDRRLVSGRDRASEAPLGRTAEDHLLQRRGAEAGAPAARCGVLWRGDFARWRRSAFPPSVTTASLGVVPT